MSDEETKVPVRRESRLGLVLARMSTTTDHNPDEVIMWDGPETHAIRELTSEEIDEYHGARSPIPEREPEPGSAEAFHQKARETVILSALQKLDHGVDADWTATGQPLVASVSRALLELGYSDVETSRAEIRKYAPTFLREGADGTGDGDEG